MQSHYFGYMHVHMTLSDVEEDTNHDVQNTNENLDQLPIQGACMNLCVHRHLIIYTSIIILITITIQEMSKHDWRISLMTFTKQRAQT